VEKVVVVCSWATSRGVVVVVVVVVVVCNVVKIYIFSSM
jgi:hypothetical protein